ncbi:MAG: hypothetical protein HKM24_05015 [Gammaproteobacteria bacterium]|nr:hypothetical protein [Gammaproteobacteria bacterium]
MKWGFLVTAVLVIAAFVAHFLVDARGYVLIRMFGYDFETSLPVFLLLLLALYGLLRLLLSVLRVPRRMRRSLGRHRRQKAYRLFSRGLVELAEGSWNRGEKLLARSANSSELPLLGYLGAARAAQLQGADERRDNWLKLAYEQDPKAAKAVLFTQAELQIAHQQFEQALATLRKVQDETPDHTQSLVLLAKIYRQVGEWEELEKLLPKLRKRKALARDKLEVLTVEVYERLFSQATELIEPSHTTGATPSDSVRSRAREEISVRWRSMPLSVRKVPAVAAAYARALSRVGEGSEAEGLVRKQLKRNWTPNLVRLYGEVTARDTLKQLNRAEQWLSDHPEDPELHLTLAALCVRNELWGKARKYLETGLDQKPSVDAYQMYGELLERLSESEKAKNAYRTGLQFALGE